ncbi:MAG: glycosyltransferase [Candidatus Bipolaricaulaceae bacterium]
MTFLIQHEWSIAGFFAVLCTIALLNSWGIRRLRPLRPRCCPKVCALVPMRDEQANAGGSVRSLLGQDYPALEVVVYEEGSTDRTPQILAGRRHPRLRVIHGRPPPQGWLGKSWACAQLADSAGAKLLLFADADVRLAPGAVAAAVAQMRRRRLQFLSVLPRQEIGSFGELLLVPLIPWSLSSFFPLFLPRLTPAAVGQFILVDRQAYLKMGGHAAVRGQVVEDMALAKRAAHAGISARLYSGGKLVSCRMYDGLRPAVDGLSKNLFAVFGKRLGLYSLAWTWILYSAWQPVWVASLAWAGLLPSGLAVPASLALGLDLCLWGYTAWRFRLPAALPLVHHLVVAAAWVVAARSAFWHLAGRGTWKGRSIHVERGIQ